VDGWENGGTDERIVYEVVPNGGVWKVDRDGQFFSRRTRLRRLPKEQPARSTMAARLRR
jgi:hypothetical protein